MRLGEGLARRAELQSRLTELRDRLMMSTLVQEGDSPPEDPDQLIKALEQAAGELEQLIATINRTNAQTEFQSGMTLTDALAKRDVLGIQHGALKAVADATAQQRARYSRSEIRVITTFDVGAVRNRLDQLARERRELDAGIQALNWTVDLAE